MSESKVAKFIKEFDNLYKESRVTIFQSFQEGGFSLSEQNEILSKLSNKNKCKLYNVLSLDSRDRYYKYLQSTGVTNTTPNAAKDFINSIREQAVADAKILERDLLKKTTSHTDVL